jgi:hypothetical protein
VSNLAVEYDDAQIHVAASRLRQNALRRYLNYALPPREIVVVGFKRCRTLCPQCCDELQHELGLEVGWGTVSIIRGTINPQVVRRVVMKIPGRLMSPKKHLDLTSTILGRLEKCEAGEHAHER